MITILGGNFPADLTNMQIILTVALSAVAVIVLYIFRSIGLFVMAKRAKLKHVILAWIPIFWTITACQLIGKKTKFFGKPFPKMAWLFCLVIGLNELILFLTDFIVYFPLIGNFFAGREIAILMFPASAEELASLTQGLTEYWGISGIYHGQDFVNPYGDFHYIFQSVATIFNMLSGIFSFASVFAVITIYVNLFRRYWPQHHVLATILSALGIFGPFVFAVRKREPVEYIDYLRSRYQTYGNPYGPYGNPYGGQGGYYGNPQAPRQPEHPFKDFAERGEVDPGDPFEEFNNDKKDK